MFKKLITLIVLVSCLTAQGDIVNRYSFNDGDTTAVDSVSGKDGILDGTATISGNKLVLDGSGSAHLPGDVLDLALESVTIEAWYTEDEGGNIWTRLFDFGNTLFGSGSNAMFCVPHQYDATRFTVATNGGATWQTGEETVSGPIFTGEQTHIACVWDGPGAEIKIYLNGALQEAAPTTMDLSKIGRMNAYIGDSCYSGDPYMTGTVDEFRIYDAALTDTEILDSYNAGTDAVIPVLKAVGPNPGNGAVEVPREVVLSWIPGDYADTHTVYLGTDEALVAAGDAGVLIAEGLTDPLLDIGVQPYSTGESIFWRVDEVNAADSTVYEGNVWSFTIEAYGYEIPANLITVSASSASEGQGPENTINESGLTDGMHSTAANDSWLSEESDPGTAWIQYDFDKAYKLVQMRVWNYNGPLIMSGLGIKDVNIEYSLDGVDWSVLDTVTELAQASGGEDYTGELFDIDIAAMSVRITGNSTCGGEMFKQYGLSEIKFYMSPVRASDPNPASGTAGLDTNVTLGWVPGRGADEHHVYISTDEQAVIDLTAPATVVTDPTLDAVLSLSNTYYWTVVEVNNNNTPAEWPTNAWNFSTVDYFVIDDFEAESLAWSASGGASVADSNAVARSGDKSMKLDFNNSTQGGVSEAKLAVNKSLVKGDPTALVFWVYGVLGNIQTEQMYVKITDNKNTAMYKNLVPTSEMATPWWTQVTVLMDDTAINWTNVKSISIGLIRASRTSGSGTVYIDDVRLYRIPPVQPVPTNPGTSNLVAYYAMENDVTDGSGNALDGTLIGEPNYVTGPFPAYGQALLLNGADDNHVELPIGPAIGTMTDCTIATWVNWDSSSMWARILDFGSGTPTYIFLCPRANSNNLRVAIKVNNSAEDIAEAPFRLPRNQWVHVAVVFDATAMSMSLYVDGELVGANENLNFLPMDMGETTQNYIGKSQWPDPLYVGSIDELRIYDKALTPGELRFLVDPTP